MADIESFEIRSFDGSERAGDIVDKLIDRVVEFFDDADRRREFLKLRRDCLLRLADWLVSPWSQNALHERFGPEWNGDVYFAYQEQLKKTKKKYLDAFARGYSGGVSIALLDPDSGIQAESTLGQLAFFMLLKKKGAIDFMKKHLTELLALRKNTTKRKISEIVEVGGKNRRSALDSEISTSEFFCAFYLLCHFLREEYGRQRPTSCECHIPSSHMHYSS